MSRTQLMLAALMVGVFTGVPIREVGAQPTTWYVDVSAPGPGTGAPSDPFPTIQAGIVAANPGDTVLVAPGVYVELISFLGKAITVVSEAGPTETHIDGNSAGTVVRFENGEGPNSVLDGFTVRGGLGANGVDATNGNAAACSGGTYPGDGEPGGILACAYPSGTCQASPTIRNCIIRDNQGGNGGMGATHYYFDPSPFGCGGCCTAPVRGGTGGAGGIGHYESPAVSSIGAPAVLVNCVFAYNTGGAGGLGPGQPGYAGVGGVEVSGGCGGIFAACEQLTNCTVVWNVAGTGAGRYGQPAGTGGVSIQTAINIGNPGVNLNVRNTIVFGNTAANGTAAEFGPTAIFTHCLVSAPGVGNVAGPPQFADPAGNDFRLLPTSSGIDAGIATGLHVPTTDFEGDPRPFHGAVDIGADETILTVTVAQAGPGAAVSLTDWNLTPGNEYYNLISFDACPGAPGEGPFLGLCASVPMALVNQVLAPVGTDPFHFIATADQQTFGPYPGLTPMPVEVVCLDVTGGPLGFMSPVTRLVVQ